MLHNKQTLINREQISVSMQHKDVFLKENLYLNLPLCLACNYLNVVLSNMMFSSRNNGSLVDSVNLILTLHFTI